MSLRVRYISIILICCFSVSLIAQEESKDRNFQYGALAQFHFSYAESDQEENPYGFRIRRVDFKVWENPTEKISWSLLMGFAEFKFQILEIDLNYKINEHLGFRIGQIAPPGVRSAAPVDKLYKVPTMSFIERPPITLHWSSYSNLHAYRTLGIQMHGKLLNEKLYYAFMMGNPKGSSFFMASSKRVSHINPENGMSLWTRLEYEIAENFVTGAFINQSKTHSYISELTRRSYGGHILFRREKLSFMTEYIQGEHWEQDISTKKYRGFFIEGAYRIQAIEPAFRFDIFDPIMHNSDDLGVYTYTNYTIGLNIYPIEKVKFQLNYIFKLENMMPTVEDISNNLFYINLQYLL